MLVVFFFITTRDTVLLTQRLFLKHVNVFFCIACTKTFLNFYDVFVQPMVQLLMLFIQLNHASFYLTFAAMSVSNFKFKLTIIIEHAYFNFSTFVYAYAILPITFK